MMITAVVPKKGIQRNVLEVLPAGHVAIAVPANGVQAAAVAEYALRQKRRHHHRAILPGGNRPPLKHTQASAGPQLKKVRGAAGVRGVVDIVGSMGGGSLKNFIMALTL